jgi:adenylate cyclase
MSDRNFFAELKRRNVYKVAVAYAVVGWLVMQVTATIVPALHLPDAITSAVVVVTLVGFPIALVLAWAFELTPEGIKRAEDVLPTDSITQGTQRKLTLLIIAVATVAAGLGGWQFFRGRTDRGGARAETTTPADDRLSGPGLSAPLALPAKSIAVLPFADLSQAKDQEYFCDGMSEELLDSLAKIEGLRVVARTSSFSFKGTKADVNEIGRKLNVSSVLEGSLRREGDRVRISAHLVNTSDGIELWHETYDRKVEGVFAMQDEITHAIVEALKIKLAVAPPPRAQQNTEAYDLYLQGLFFSNKSTEHDLRKSLDLFEQALARDPKLGRAWTGIAKAWTWLADAYVKPLEGYRRCQEAANRALAIDERDAEAHVYLGETKRILSYDMKGEELELKRALEVDPNSATAHLFMGLWQTAEGNRAEGLKEFQTAIRVDPLSPIVGSMSVLIELANDRFDQATAEAHRTMEIDPNYIYFEPNLARVYRQEGKLAEALEIYLRVEEARHQPMAGLAITYAALGRKEEARKVLTQLIQQADSTYFPGEEIAAVYVSLGENDEAIHWLERAVSEHSGAIHGISSTRELRPLHSDPRFVALLRQIGLDPSKSLRRD